MSAYTEFQLKSRSVDHIESEYGRGNIEADIAIRVLVEKQKQVCETPSNQLKGQFDLYTPTAKKKLDKIAWAITRILTGKTETQLKETCEMSKKNDSTTVDKIVIPTSTKKATASRSKAKVASKKTAAKKSAPKATAPKGKKLCTTCDVTKPVSEFAKNKARADGLHGRCRSCESEYQKSRRTDGKVAPKKTASKKKVAPKKAAVKKTGAKSKRKAAKK